MHYQKRRSEDIAANAKKITDKLRDKSESLSLINLINSNTESSASNNVSLGSNNRTKAGTFTVNNTCMKKYLFQNWTSILNDSNYKSHSSRNPRTLTVRAKKLFKRNCFLFFVKLKHFKTK